MMQRFQQPDFALAIQLIERKAIVAPVVRQLRWASKLIIHGQTIHPEIRERFMRIVHDRIVSALLRQFVCASTLKHSNENKRTAKLSTVLRVLPTAVKVSAVPTQFSLCSSLNCDGVRQ